MQPIPVATQRNKAPVEFAHWPAYKRPGQWLHPLLEAQFRLDVRIALLLGDEVRHVLVVVVDERRLEIPSLAIEDDFLMYRPKWVIACAGAVQDPQLVVREPARPKSQFAEN